MEFRDLATQYQKLKPQMDKALTDACAQARFIQGPQVKELEAQLADYVGMKHCVSCANGTDALSLVLMAWGIGEGDAVFVPDLTFFASAETVAFEGATPIFVDVEEESFNMDAASLKAAVEQVLAEGALKPRAVVPVDLFGLPANYDAILPVAKQYGLKVLEDGAQGFGGRLHGKPCCSFGDTSTTSFFPAKPLGCYGDGGAVFTNSDEEAALMRSYAFHGKGSHKYDNVRIGVNSRLDTLQAAILQVKMSVFDEEVEAVNELSAYYDSELSGLLKTPVIPQGYLSSRAQYNMRLASRQQRDGLQKHLEDNGVPTMIYFPIPLHKQKAFEGTRSAQANCPVTEKLCETVLAIPMHPYMSAEDRQTVTRLIKAYLTQN